MFRLCLCMLLISQPLLAAPKVVAKVTPVVSRTWQHKVNALGTLSPAQAVRIQSTVTERITAMPFRDGANVKAGDILVELERAEEEAALMQAEARLTEQLRELKRIESLVMQKTLPTAQLDEQRTKVEDARASVAISQARLADRVIRAPFSGVLGLREYSPGALLLPGNTITTLDHLDIMHLDFPVPEKVLGQIRTGQSIKASAITYPGRFFEGQVIAIDSRIDVETRTTRVRARVPNPEGLLRSGMLMTLELTIGETDLPTVPEDAVFQLQRQHFVFRLDDKNVLQRVTVEVSSREEGLLAIVSGLQAGERVVATGTHKLRPGMQVEEAR